MTQILTIAGFITLYIVAYRVAHIKRDEPFGFQPPKKKSWLDKLLRK